jgi:hypothetical protein
MIQSSGWIVLSFASFAFAIRVVREQNKEWSLAAEEESADPKTSWMQDCINEVERSVR